MLCAVAVVYIAGSCIIKASTMSTQDLLCTVRQDVKDAVYIMHYVCAVMVFFYNKFLYKIDIY